MSNRGHSPWGQRRVDFVEDHMIREHIFDRVCLKSTHAWKKGAQGIQQRKKSPDARCSYLCVFVGIWDVV